jgi:hypothetical protein
MSIKIRCLSISFKEAFQLYTFNYLFKILNKVKSQKNGGLFLPCLILAGKARSDRILIYL